MIEIFILSLIQGFTEFLPVSSSSHLIIIGEITKFDYSNIFLDISLHIGSFLAVLIYFRNYVLEFLENRKTLSLILISSLPILFFGFLIINFKIVENLRSIQIIAWMTIIFGVLLFISDKFKTSKNLKKDLNLKSAIIIGFIHSLALIPGVSRSGIAITAARFLGFERSESAKISFLISIPTLFMVSVYGVFSLYKKNLLEVSNINIVSIVLSFIFSYLTIKFLLIFLKKFDLKIFVIYRLFLGLFLLFYF